MEKDPWFLYKIASASKDCTELDNYYFLLSSLLYEEVFTNKYFRKIHTKKEGNLPFFNKLADVKFFVEVLIIFSSKKS